MCVGGIDLIQWKQGNTCFKSILKDLSLRDLFFCELLDIYIYLILEINNYMFTPQIKRIIISN